MPEVTLNLPGRDQKIEEYKQYLRDLGKAGIRYTTYAHMGNGIWTSGRTDGPRGVGPRIRSDQPEGRATGPARSARARSRTAASSRRKRSGTTTPTSSSRWPRSPRRPASASASTRTIRRCRCSPACPRCIFGNFDGYKRALEIANSPNVGICLCCGTWLEGGKPLTGQGSRGDDPRTSAPTKIWKIHFRNVSAPLPHFVETFMDDGYYDMYKIMKALRDVDFDGIVILDHSPSMVGGNYAQTAYGFAYMRALLNRANAEAKG